MINLTFLLSLDTYSLCGLTAASSWCPLRQAHAWLGDGLLRSLK
jgi:hypothetical protein